MKVGLFVPCYVDQFYPQVAVATLQLLEKFGCTVVYPASQTCCGQPMANAGYANLTSGCNANFIEQFSSLDYIVSPSGSCVAHLKDHLHAKGKEAGATHIKSSLFELTAFLIDVLKVEKLKATFPAKVGLHVSCHGQRLLHLSSMSERMEPPFSKAEFLLKQVSGLELIKTDRWDECCGFGGTFCVTEEAVSISMGKDRVAAHAANKVEYITGGDMSCLMHLEGILKRQQSAVKVLHIAQILNAS